MGIKGQAIYAISHLTRRRIESEARKSSAHQKALFHHLISRGSHTSFGREHNLRSVKNHKEYIDKVAIRDYEDFRPYIDDIIRGSADVLWPGRPLYLAKTSGTTSGIKYIPITRESIPNHVGSARKALFNMSSRLKLASIFDGKMIFLSGSPVLEEKGGIPTGRLSGIVNHWIPVWLKGNQLPSYQTNCIEDWNIKVARIAEETVEQDMRLISGIPPWVQMYYEELLKLTGKKNVREIFPNLQLFVYGGVNFAPYRDQLETLTGGPVDSIETYPASEGFIAFQDLVNVEEGLLLQCNSGIYFEFVSLSEIHSPQPVRLTLDEVQTGIDYVLILTTTAGLWSYNIGDTVEFISLHPPRIRVTGRVKHFISAFGEHVIAKEVEEALHMTLQRHTALVNEFTVAPQVTPPADEKPYHEWWIEFSQEPNDIREFSLSLNEAMMAQNIYYDDLIRGNILQPLRLRLLPKGAFRKYMHSVGKLGGQNKVPRLSNDRQIADVLAQLFPTA
jgi:hypothetical protein